MSAESDRRNAASLEPHGLPVKRGQIVCPRRGRTDIETCFTCRDFQGFREGESESLICLADGDPDVMFAQFTLAPR
jgi:hypothetical protein